MKPHIKAGIFFSLFMFVFTVILFPLLLFDEDISIRKILLGIVLWTIGGFLYAYFSKPKEK